MNTKEAEATRKFVIRDILIGYYGGELTTEFLEKTVTAIEEAVISGYCSWAFADSYAPDRLDNPSNPATSARRNE